jgi:hypothetical protein
MCEDWKLFNQSWGNEHDVGVPSEGGRPAVNRDPCRGRRCQRRGVLRHAVGHAAFRPAAGPRPAPAIPAAGVWPLHRDGVRVAELAFDEETRGRATP